MTVGSDPAHAERPAIIMVTTGVCELSIISCGLTVSQKRDLRE